MMQDGNTRNDLKNFASLVDALTPWLEQMVIIGGWAQRLYRLHHFAQPLDYEPLATIDTDVAVPVELPRRGEDIASAWLQTDSRRNCSERHGLRPFITG